MKAGEIRKAAWGKLHGNWTTMVLITLIEIVILSAVSFTFIGSLLIGGAITLGVMACALGLSRSQKVEISDMFKGFNRFVEALILYILYTVFVALWSILFIIPGIIAMIRYSMAYFILQDNPEMKGFDAIKASCEMMKGHKMELFCLALSFIGWFLLGCITFGIGFLWVIPYYRTAKAEFYEKIKSSNAVVVEEKQEN